MPPTDIDDRELDRLSDEERAALEDEDPGSPEDVEKAAAAAEAIRDDEPAKPADDAPADTDAAAEATDSQEFTAVRLTPAELDGYEERLNALLDERKQIREQYRNGDISAEDKDRTEDEINDKIADLRAAKQNRDFVDQYNQQVSEQEHLRNIARVKADAKDNDGIDYDNNPMMLQAWDRTVRTLAADPANAARSSEWFLREAHKIVLDEARKVAESLGFQKGERRSSQDSVNDAVRRRRPALPEGARSLATLPAAASDSALPGSEFSHLDNLSGDDLEMAVARMTPEQQERWARA